MNDKERVEAFLADILPVYMKHGLHIESCGCCNSPWVYEIKGDNILARGVFVSLQEGSIQCEVAGEKTTVHASLPTVAENAKVANGWIPCSEQLPDKNTRVLVYAMGMVEADIGPVSVNWGWMCHKKLTGITHWMPIPKLEEVAP